MHGCCNHTAAILAADKLKKEQLCTYRCYVPLPPAWAIVGQDGDLITGHPLYLQKPVGD